MRRRRWWLGGALLLLLLPVTGLGLAAALVDPEYYRPQIAAAVERSTGRTLELRGPVRISRSLWPTIEVLDATLANLPGGSRPDMARVEKIEARLSLPALLRRRLDIGSLTLVGPNILFEFVNGRPNWVFGQVAVPENAATSPSVAVPSDPAIEVRVAEAQVRNGMVTLRLPRRTHVVGIRSLAFRRPMEGGPIELATELVYQDNAPFRLSAAANPTGGLMEPWDTRLAFSAFEAAVAATGRVSLGGTYDLRAEGNAPVLERLNALLPPMRLPALRGLRIATHLTSGPAPGDLPVIGETRLRLDAADLSDRVPGLRLGRVEVALPEVGGTATASGAGTLGERVFSFAGTLDMPRHLDGVTSPPVTLRARVTPEPGHTPGPNDGSLELDGRLTLHEALFNGLDGAVGLRLPALAAWQLLPATALPPLTDVTLRGRLTLTADLATLRLRQATLSAHQIEARGEATLGLGAGTMLDGRLRMTRLDLDALLPTSGPRASPATTPGARLIPDVPLPWGWVRGKKVDFAARIDALTLRNQVWRDVDVALELAGNRLQLAQLRLGLPAGPAELAVSADASVPEVPVTLRVRAPGVPLGLISRTLGLPGEASGALRLDAQLRAQGSSARDLAASLTGPFGATMLEGSLSNAALVSIASAALEALGITVPEAGRTAIRCLGVIGAFQDGVGQLRTLALDSTHLQVAGTGQVDLAKETLALALRPVARVVGAPVEVPVVVEGPFRAIEGRLDADAFDRLGLLLSALTGGDQSRVCAEAGLGRSEP